MAEAEEGTGGVDTPEQAQEPVIDAAEDARHDGELWGVMLSVGWLVTCG